MHNPFHPLTGLLELLTVLFIAYLIELFTAKPEYPEAEIERGYGCGYWPEDFR